MIQGIEARRDQILFGTVDGCPFVLLIRKGVPDRVIYMAGEPKDRLGVRGKLSENERTELIVADEYVIVFASSSLYRLRKLAKVGGGESVVQDCFDFVTKAHDNILVAG